MTFHQWFVYTLNINNLIIPPQPGIDLPLFAPFSSLANENITHPKKTLTARPEAITLLRRLELLLHRLFEPRLGPPGCTPNLEFHIILSVETMVEENAGEVDVAEVPSEERSEPVLGEVLDPFRSRSRVGQRIFARGHGAAVVTAHRIVLVRSMDGTGGK